MVSEVQDMQAFHPCLVGGYAAFIFSVVKSAEQLPDSHQACPPRRQYALYEWSRVV